MVINAPFFHISDAQQLSLLNRQLAYAVEHSRYYRQTIGAYNELQSLSELAKLPFTDAATLLEQGKAMLCVHADAIRRIVSLQSSGTSGKMKRLYFSEKDLEHTVCFFAEGMSLLCSSGDAVGIFFPGETPDGLGNLLSRGLRRIGASPFSCVTGDRQELAELLRKARPDVLVGMPRQIRMAAVLVPELRPRSVLLSADYVSDSVRSYIENIWECQVFEHYGMTELCYGGAVESPARDGMLVRRDAIRMEIIEPVTGIPLADGETGEIVITTLQREAMPLIRYRTGDIGMMRDGRLIYVAGRTDDRLMPALDELLAACSEVIDYSLSKDARKRCVTLHVAYRDRQPNVMDSVRALLESAFPDMQLNMELCGVSDVHADPLCNSKRKLIETAEGSETL